MTAREMYKKWLTDFAGDADLVRELGDIGDEEKAIEERFYTELEFGTAGMRGVIGAGTNRMNVYAVRRATQGLADHILKTGGAARGVVIAYDSRRFSPEFALSAALVLCKNGVRAYLFESLRPVPVLSFSVRELKAAAGIVITASHNPAEYNGYKVYGPDGGQMPPEDTASLVGYIRSHDYKDCVEMPRGDAERAGLLTIVGKELDDEYTARVKTLCVQPGMCAQMGKDMRIVYTPLNGSGNVPVRRVLREIGFEHVCVVPEQENPDPAFSTVGTPNPENHSAFTLAIKLANETNADLVFGTDPDCDRLGVAVRAPDGSYQVLSGNQIGCLLTHYALSGKKASGTMPENPAVIKTIVTTEMARAIAASFGAVTFDVLTGCKFIAEKIQLFEDTGSHAFIIGFEESYGYLAGSFVRDKDAVIASMLIAETAAWYKSRGIALYDAMQALYKEYGYYGEKSASVTMPGKDGIAEMGRVMRALRAAPPSEIGGAGVLAVRDYLSSARVCGGKTEKIDLPVSDVLYYELVGGEWVCVRPSGTEPKIKFYFNSRTDHPEKTAERLDALASSMFAAVGKL